MNLDKQIREKQAVLIAYLIREYGDRFKDDIPFRKLQAEITSLISQEKEKKPLTAVSMLEKHGFDFYKFDMDSEYSAKNLLKAMEEYASQKQLPTDEDVMLYFAKHCKNSITMSINYQVFTRGQVLEFAKWMRDATQGS